MTRTEQIINKASAPMSLGEELRPTFEFWRGLNFENKRLAPLISGLAECVEALPEVPDHCGEHSHLGMSLDHKDCDIIREALAKLDELLKGTL